ncbi:helix-turn-helix domain-containing protein [Isoptericola haloaureus]|uniref:Helix-turn-helix domain-containing protein n=1 Tax=Isoptericola haloaureus TaxID=1542902 RepID=A0ABU7Z3G5_9MICO
MTRPDEPARARTRLSREARLAQIIDATVRILAARGFHGLSLRSVAEELGLSEAGLLHYVGTKEGLLALVVEQAYDRRFDPDDFVASGDPAATHPEGVSFPAYCRFLVRHNADDLLLVQLYSVLNAESISPEHPAHDYFADRPAKVWELYSRTTWRLPPSVGGWENMRDLVEMSIEAMDGIQVRAFRRPTVDMYTEWLRFEEVLFPSPRWDGYR